MVNFLLKRPIAVSMSFLAILILGIVSITKLPVSLMPDIDIPKVSVHVAYPNHSAIELERTVAKPLRQQLMQVSHLTDIRSESQDGNCIINLDFEHGVEIDYIFIEVNEKIDRAINNLPRDIRRPKVMKASATDIPVFYLNLTLKDNKLNNDKGESNKELFPVTQDFVNLSNFSNQVIKKRIEQLKEVAMVDISGLVFPELLILPNLQKMESLNIQLSDIEGAIRSNNINLGNMLIRDGQYQYSIRFASTIRTIEDIGSIYLKVKDRLIQLKDVAQIIEHPANRSGLVTSNGKEAITMAVIKQADAQMRDLKKELDILLKQFRKDYPHIEFETSRNQTKLLDYSISNLGQSLLIGGLLAFFIMFLFLKDFKSPFLIGIAIPASIIISLLFFYIAGISLNIVSISGLILGVGMMIDNSIIVIDNITQNRERGRNLFQSCVIGANEVFRPLLSSVLTTCAVFIPLIFIQGISGALFFDQAMAITIGLFVSLAVSIMLVPVYYRLFYIKDQKFSSRFLSRINRINYDKLYERGFHITMRNQGWSWLIFVLMLALLFPLYGKLDKARLPQMAKEEILVYIDWNDRINLEENKSRVEHLTEMVKEIAEQFTCLIGNQQFLLDHSSSLTSSESVIYIMAGSDENCLLLKISLMSILKITTHNHCIIFQMPETSLI